MRTTPLIERLLRAPWPLPAVLVWLACWGWFVVARALGLGVAWAGGLATAVGLWASRWGGTRWRRLFMALGFPLSWGALAASAGVPPWVWLVPLAVVLLLYPPTAWRDAPLFPTPRDALVGLNALAPLPPMARVLDAGAGVGDGLLALERAYPDARLEGVERSAPLAWLARLRCPFATVRRGDMWAQDWGAYGMVYLFQRPETMPQAAAKAVAEMRPGAWLVSLAFEAPGLEPVGRLDTVPGRTVWVYQPADTVQR